MAVHNFTAEVPPLLQNLACRLLSFFDLSSPFAWDRPIDRVTSNVLGGLSLRLPEAPGSRGTEGISFVGRYIANELLPALLAAGVCVAEKALPKGFSQELSTSFETHCLSVTVRGTYLSLEPIL